jgi:excisionase family DNA binding protein
MTFAEAPDVLTVAEAASLIRIGVKSIYRAVASGELYAARIGKQQLRIPKRALLAWLDPENESTQPHRPQLNVLNGKAGP